MSKLEEAAGNNKVRKDFREIREENEQKIKEEKERQCRRGVEEGRRQQQHCCGLHSNDVTSCWHCWTEKQISHLIFALILVPVSSSQLMQPAYWNT